MKKLFVNTRKKEKIDEETNNILMELEQIKMRLDYAELCLNFTSDELLIDSIIYETMSLKNRYDYYLKKVKQKGGVEKPLNILHKFPAS